MSDAILSIHELTDEIPTRHGILRPMENVNYDIGEGEILGVVGESGAGKSMAGNAVLGLLSPPAHIANGEIRVNGMRLDRLEGEDMRRLRGKEIGITGACQRVDSYPHEFSGGMRQRVVIALALCAAPWLIIADESTTALDVSVQAQIIAQLKKLCRKRGTALMLITQDIGVISEAADRVAVMYAGKLVDIGPVREVLTRPHHPYTHGLMGSTPLAWRGKARLYQIPGAMPRHDALPLGCAFHPRCAQAQEACRQDPGPDIDDGDARAACLLPLTPEAVSA
jgi:peptide/nickel transport system ATP-binding protein